MNGLLGRGERLSPLDAAFLYFDRPEQRLHVGCVAILEESLPFEAFVDAVDQRLVRPLARYRQRPVRQPFDWGRPQWVDDPQFDVRRHVRRVALPAPGGDLELQELVDSVFAARLDPAHPLWDIHLIEGLRDGQIALLCKVHHSMIDGVSGAQILAALTDPAGGDEPRLPPGATRSDATGLAALIDGVSDLAEAAGLMASLFLRPPPATPFNGRLSDARRVVWAGFPLDDILTLRGAAGVKMNDVVLAIVTGALRMALQRRGVTPPVGGLRLISPVSTRRADERLQLGNLVAAMFPSLPVDVADPAERLRRIAEETRALKSRGQARAVGRALGALGMLPTPLAAMAGRLMDASLVNTVCTNVPGPRERRSLLGVPLLELHPIVPLFFGMGVEFAVMSYADRLSISAVADPHLVPEIAEFPRWLQAAATELRTVLPTSLPKTIQVAAPNPLVRVADLMTTAVDSVTPDAPVATVAGIMTTRRVRHVPVVDAGRRLLGVITHRDLLALQPSALQLPAEADRTALLGHIRVGEVMETHVAVARADEPAAVAGERLRRHRIGCLPVVDTAGRLMGIVTRGDFLAWATQHLASPKIAAAVGG